MRPFANSFVQALCAVMQQNASRVALRCRGDVLTYEDLLQRAGVLCDIILAQGVGPGERIALIGQRDSADYIGLLAVLLAGCAYVPLNPKAPRARNAYVLRHSGAVAMLADSAFASALTPEPDSAVRFMLNSETGVALKWPEPRARLPSQDFSNGVYIIYTSGTTGEPKGVPITGVNLQAYLSSLKGCFSIQADDRVAHLSDLSFDLSVHEILLAWANGAALCCIPQSAALLAARYVEEEDINVWVSVPSTISLANKAGTLKAGSMRKLRLAFFCGEALAQSTVRQFTAAAPHAEIYNLWGPTEATVSLSHFRIELSDDLPEIIPIGRPYDAQLLTLRDDDGVPVAPGQIGELWIAGTQLTAGYWQSRMLNEQRFRIDGGQRWYRTGDLALWDHRYGYCYRGRMDRQVKLKGYRIELQECESALRQQCGGQEVCVIAWPLSDSGTALGLVAFVEAAQIDAEALKEVLLGTLPSYMVPSRIIAHSKFPYTTNGKLDVKAFDQIMLALVTADEL